MSNSSLEKLESVFSQEMFTRKQVKSYSIKDFEELFPTIEEIEESDIDAAIDLSSKQLERNQQNVAALYSCAILNFKKKNYSDSNFEKLLLLFKKQDNWDVVEYLSKKILSFVETDYALKYLAHYYENVKRRDEALAIWERLIRFDSENPELPEKIAHLKEEAGDLKGAETYYKISFERNLAKHRAGEASANIKKILELDPDNFLYLAKHESALSQLVEADFMIDKWKMIFFYYSDASLYKEALKTIKHLLAYEHGIVRQNNKKAKFFRHRLVEIYECLYPNHSLIEKIKEISNITNVFKDPKACVEIFENYIQYDIGRYVYHRNFGVGKIKSISIESVIIKFTTQDLPRTMSFDMAIKSLTMLEADDIYVYKAYKLEDLKKLAVATPTEILSMILKYKDSITTKDLKQELVPVIVPEATYTKWLESVKKLVRASTTVKFEKNAFLYNKNALSYDLETIRKFTETKDFLLRYQIYMEYLHYSKDAKSEEAKKMHDYFIDVANDSTKEDYELIISTILLKMQGEQAIPSIDDLILKAKNYTKIYELLPSANYRDRYISSIASTHGENADKIISGMLYSSQVKNHYLIVNKLINEEKIGLLEDTIGDIFFHYKEYPESFLYFAQKVLDGEYVETIGKNIKINTEILMADMLSLIPFLNKLSDKKEISSHSRKMLKTVYDLLFEKEHLLRFIETESEESVKKIYSEFQKLTSLEQHYQADIISSVTKRFPAFM